MKSIRALSIALATLAIVPTTARDVAAQPAPASQDTERAKKHFERGRELTDAKQYAAAYAEFEAGYALSQRPLFLFNMGECSRAMGQPKQARDLYEKYLAADPNGAFASQARSRLTELPASPPVAPPPRVDPTPPAPPVRDTARTTPPAAPPARVADPVTAPSTNTQLTGTNGLVDRPPTSTPIYKKPVFWVGVGAAVAAGTVAIYMATRSDTECPMGTCIDLRGKD